MKTVFNIVLVLCAAALIYICYSSIMGPINFEKAKKEREQAVIARLIDIRKSIRFSATIPIFSSFISDSEWVIEAVISPSWA